MRVLVAYIYDENSHQTTFHSDYSRVLYVFTLLLLAHATNQLICASGGDLHKKKSYTHTQMYIVFYSAYNLYVSYKTNKILIEKNNLFKIIAG